jgi:hypothetical protein
MEKVVAIAAGLLLLIPTGVTAATSPRSAVSAQPIYAAFALTARNRPVTKRCGAYTVTRATYTGRSFGPDARLAGAATFTGRVTMNANGGTGFASGTLVIRDGGRRVRARASLTGVLTERSTVNGIFAGRLTSPNARLLANVTIVFDPALRFAVIRLGVESGANTAVAYPSPPNCR